MKKRIALFSVILALSILGYVAYTKSTTVPLSKETAQDQMESTETMKLLGEGSASPAGGEQPANQTNVNIITKSDNIYTDAQKQEILNQLTEEIDQLIQGINNLEDAQDSELIFD